MSSQSLDCTGLSMARHKKSEQCSYKLLGSYIFLLIFIDKVSTELTCDDIERLGSGARLEAEQLEDLPKLSNDDLKDCFVLLGKEPLLPEKATAIWNSVLKIYGSAEDVPEERLQQLGWVSSGIPAEQFMNLSYTDVDTVSAFGEIPYLSKQQLVGLKDAVMEQWYGKSEEDLTSYDLATLKQILCAFNATSIQMIHPISYKGAAAELALLNNCSDEVIRELAILASSNDAFGDPSSWTSIQVANVGCIISGLESVSVVPAALMDGLTPDIMKCLPARVIKSMQADQIRNLAPAAASAMSAEQTAGLDANKRYALKQAITGLSTKESGSDRNSLKFQVVILMMCTVL